MRNLRISHAKFVILLSFCFVGLTEILPGAFDLGTYGHTLLFQLRSNCFFTSAFLGAFALYLYLKPGRNTALVVTCGLIAEIILFIERSGTVSFFKNFLCLGLGLGICAFICAFYDWVTNYNCNNDSFRDLPSSESSFALIAAVPSLELLTGYLTSVNILPHLYVYDYILYSIDGLLGFQPSLVISDLTGDTISSFVLNLVYYWLPLWMAFSLGVNCTKQNPLKNYPLVAFFLIGVVGSCIYLYLPAVGIRALTDSLIFQVPQDIFNKTELVKAPEDLPRNCMPSLHTAWILAFYWSCSKISPKIKIIASSLAIFTIISAFTVGHHYLIDTVIAVPFAAALHAISVKYTPQTKIEQIVCVIFGLFCTICWISIFKYASDIILENGIFIWISIIISCLVSLWLHKIFTDKYCQVAFGNCSQEKAWTNMPKKELKELKEQKI